MIKTALTQAQAAVTLLPGDQEIKGSADALAAVADRQEKSIVAMKQQVTVLAEACRKQRLTWKLPLPVLRLLSSRFSRQNRWQLP